MTKEEVIKEYRVREILEAARRVMARYGMQGTTVDRVAEEAKVAKGTIYLYFDTKDELVHAAVLEGLREMVAETIASDDPSIPPLERIRKLILAQFRIQASNQDFLKTLIIGNSLDIELESEAGREYMRVYAGHLDFMASVLAGRDRSRRDSADRSAFRGVHARRDADRVAAAAAAQAGVESDRVGRGSGRGTFSQRDCGDSMKPSFSDLQPVPRCRRAGSVRARGMPSAGRGRSR